MELISLILSGLALLVAAVNLTLFLVWRKRDNKRYETLLEYIDESDDLSIGASKKFTKDALSEQMDCFDEMFDAFGKKINERLKNFDGTVNGCFVAFEKRVSDLEHGICPDFNAAMAAKESVDKFSEGVMNILCYGGVAPPKDPREKPKEDNE